MIEKIRVQPIMGSSIYNLFSRRKKTHPKTKVKARKRNYTIDKRYEPSQLELEYQNIGNIIFYQNINL